MGNKKAQSASSQWDIYITALPTRLRDCQRHRRAGAHLNSQRLWQHPQDTGKLRPDRTQHGGGGWKEVPALAAELLVTGATGNVHNASGVASSARGICSHKLDSIGLKQKKEDKNWVGRKVRWILKELRKGMMNMIKYMKFSKTFLKVEKISEVQLMVFRIS